MAVLSVEHRAELIEVAARELLTRDEIECSPRIEWDTTDDKTRQFYRDDVTPIVDAVVGKLMQQMTERARAREATQQPKRVLHSVKS